MAFGLSMHFQHTRAGAVRGPRRNMQIAAEAEGRADALCSVSATALYMLPPPAFGMSPHET